MKCRCRKHVLVSCLIVVVILLWAAVKDTDVLRHVDIRSAIVGKSVIKIGPILPASANITGELLFKTKPLVIWATEWHMTPIKDMRHVLEPFGVRVLDYNLDPWRCEFHDCSAKARLKVLNPDNELNIDPPIPEKFYEAYKDDAEMKTVDAFFCGYPASLCEMYERFNKSVIVLASTRLVCFAYECKGL